ncbi:MAG: cell division protein ZapA [Bdellovibrionota bacterium]
MASKKSVSIRILDQSFLLNTDASPERVEKIAELVSENLEKALARSKTPSPYNAAILVALNLAEKYLDAVEKQNAFKAQVGEKSKKILGLLGTTGQKS